MSYVIHENDEALLKTLTRTPESDDLPLVVQEKYWEYMRVLNRNCSERPTVQTLALLVVLSGLTAPTAAEQAAKPIPAQVRDGEVQPGDAVEVNWRKRWTPAQFVGVTAAGEVRAVINGTERDVPAEDVRKVALAAV